MLIVLPSIVSGIGVAFLLAGIFIDQSILRAAVREHRRAAFVARLLHHDGNLSFHRP